jgi:hypothetical protein
LPRDVDDLSLLGGVGDVLELALVGDLQVLKLRGVVVVEVGVDGDGPVVVFAALDLGDGSAYLVEGQRHALL